MRRKKIKTKSYTTHYTILVFTIIGLGIITFNDFGLLKLIQLYQKERELYSEVNDLLKASDQKPIDQEQFLIQESLAGDLEKTITRVDEMMHNGVNIQRMMKDIDRLRNDVEMLKDKVRKNGSSYSSVNVSE